MQWLPEPHGTTYVAPIIRSRALSSTYLELGFFSDSLTRAQTSVEAWKREAGKTRKVLHLQFEILMTEGAGEPSYLIKV